MGGACDDVWLGFPASSGRPARWVGCRRITSVSEPEQSWLAPDYALLELDADVERPPIPIAKSGVEPGDVVRMVTVTADRFYDDFHEVRTRRCLVNGGGQLRASGLVAPPTVRVLSSCPIREGSSGAPVLDREGYMHGLVHAGGPPYFALGVMTLLPQPVDHGHH